MKRNEIIYLMVCVFLILCLIVVVEHSILEIVTKINRQDLLFVFSTTIFGFVLTSYGIFLSLFSNLNKLLKESKAIKVIIFSHLIFLIIMLIPILFSLRFIFYTSEILIYINGFIFGFILARYFISLLEL